MWAVEVIILVLIYPSKYNSAAKKMQYINDTDKLEVLFVLLHPSE